MSQSYNSEAELPTIDFIAGLINTIGAFMWVRYNAREIPVFQIKIQVDQIELVQLVKQKLGLNEIIHKYRHQNREYALLLVRKRKTIESIIIPSFDGRLFGKKALTFDNWKKKFYEKKLEYIYAQHS
ncbi:MAG: LAGLIDADG family homing endonuclease [Patescibacteria group bacterium]